VLEVPFQTRQDANRTRTVSHRRDASVIPEVRIAVAATLDKPAEGSADLRQKGEPLPSGEKRGRGGQKRPGQSTITPLNRPILRRRGFLKLWFSLRYVFCHRMLRGDAEAFFIPRLWPNGERPCEIHDARARVSAVL
jgi:hypothetical protein